MHMVSAPTVVAAERAGTHSTFSLITQSADGWEMRYVPRPRSMTTVEVEGQTCFRFVDSGVMREKDDATGTPSLPADAITLGIPFGSQLMAELVDVEFSAEENMRIAPHPAYEFTQDNDAIELFRKDRSAYAQNAYFPSTLIHVEKPFTLREQHLCVVRVHPYQYNPAASSLRRIVRATLRVRLIAPSASATHTSSATGDPLFEDTYKALIWNYDQAKQWRRAIREQDNSQNDPDPTRDWFETGRTYFKIPVARDGWYKITRADLLAAGADPNALDLPTIKVFAKGIQVPIVIRPDTTIEFYAYRNYGDSTFFDFYTDTSVYWLTWGGAAGMRFTPSIHTGTPSATIVSAPHTLHVEENWSYFIGASELASEMIDINTIPGEGWYWRWFNVNNQFDFSFVLDSLDASVPICSLRVRLWGTSYFSPPRQHRARFWLNDSLIGDLDFNQRQAAMLNVALPAHWFRQGTNTLRVRNVDLGLGNTKFYLDWFEIDYRRMLQAVDNQLLFVGSNPSGMNPAEFVIGGFSSPDIEVYDRTNARAIAGVVISGDSTSGYTAVFRDTVSVPRSYVALARPGALAILSLRQKTFADIRVSSIGADYIIVAHRTFMTQANQLAAHRQTINGVRAKVIDVEDIYDEFNYGIFSAIPVKAFLRYAYAHWPSPSPAFVLLFGDASNDFHKYYGGSSIKNNFVPAYGFPTADNWYACFDSTYPFLPSLYIGRIPSENVVQAQIAVNKAIGFDNYSISEWNKRFLYITGGTTVSEQAGFNFLAENSINTYVTPPPFGGTPVRVYKTTPGYVDGENKQKLKQIIREGVSFISFTGHSGGRVWGVDAGHPNELENTNGKLPFVCSVTCNVGGFATPFNNVLAEDLLFADNRGGIASWASSWVGYATYGAALTNFWLANATQDSVRELGKLSTTACIRLWIETGSGYITIAMVNLNPLIGDPLSQFAVPRKPELAVGPEDITLTTSSPTPNDSILTIRVTIHNYGLVPPDSVGLTLTDVYRGSTTYLLNNRQLRPTLHVDSLFFSWNGKSQVGPHTLVASLDPANTIEEVSELNNIASSDQYVYTNNVYVVRPLNNMLVPPGVQRLVVTSPIGYDSAGFSYHFELDTVDTFDSPALVVSGSVMPDNAKGEWLTPSLPAEQLYFWRVRTLHKSLAGTWVTSAFTTSTDIPLNGKSSEVKVRVREQSAKQFMRDLNSNTLPSDSGVTIAPSAPLSMYVRSVGFRYNQTLEYYSTVRANAQYATGFWWELGSSFMVMRVNDFTGRFTFKSFNVASNPALSDSMIAFINATPVGNYIGIAVIFDGQSNVGEPVKRAMDTLGATLFRSIVYGQSYAFLGRKGNGSPGMTALERLTNDTAVVSLTVPNYYSLASGSITSTAMPVAASWDSLHWRSAGDAGLTDIRFALLGVRSTGGVDTLRIFPRDSADVSLASLDSVTAGANYSAVNTAVLLSTSDANYTPRLTQWWLDFTPPADLAVSARTLGQTEAAVYQFPITVHNIGYRTTDSVSVKVYSFDRMNNSRLIAETVLDSISVEGSRTTTVPISTVGYGYRMLLQVVVRSLNQRMDLVPENNVAYYTLYKSGIAPPKLQVYNDGKLLMDGDYVPPKPIILVRVLPEESTPAPAAARMNLFVNDTKIEQAASVLSKSVGGRNSTLEETFTPSLPNGRHALKFRLTLLNERGEVDTLEHVLNVQVLGETKIVDPYTYPNPFPQDTYFTFVLVGASVPDEMRIRIYTVAGRRIRDIEVSANSLRIGFNQVYWDGRDSDGDEIANGYYFYELIATHGGKTHSAIQKLVKLR